MLVGQLFCRSKFRRVQLRLNLYLPFSIFMRKLHLSIYDQTGESYP